MEAGHSKLLLTLVLTLAHMYRYQDVTKNGLSFKHLKNQTKGRKKAVLKNNSAHFTDEKLMQIALLNIAIEILGRTRN